MHIQQKLTVLNKCDRVKCIDFHPTEPWILLALYNGKVMIYDYEKKETRNLFEPVVVPIRCCKFIARKQWFVIGSDDMKIRVYNYNTLDQVALFVAHQDFIRALDVHETKPYLITCSDDMVIKLWDWDHNFSLIRTYEGHNYFIMSVKFNPKDPNSFATASLDRTIKIWNISSSTPNYSLTGHTRGLNTIDYYPGSDKPYIISGSDDHTIKIWDYQTKTCIYTLEGHHDNVTCVKYHPRLPLILSVAEDDTVILWNTQTYKIVNYIPNSMERGWCVCADNGSGKVAFGFDSGFSVFQIGTDIPTVSMDTQGKLIWSVQNDIYTSSIQLLTDSEGLNDKEQNGEILGLNTKDLGRCEITPVHLYHSPNSRYVCICDDNEYYIYTSRQLRNKAYGKAIHFTWGLENGSYAVSEQGIVHVYHNFNPACDIQLDSTSNNSLKGIYTGECLSMIFNDYILFYNWTTGAFIRRIDVKARFICWCSDNTQVAIFTKDEIFILNYNSEKVENHEYTEEEKTTGIYDAFEIVSQHSISAKRGEWYNHALIVFSDNKLKYIIGDYVETISYVGVRKYYLKYIPKDRRVYFTDNHYNITSYILDASILDYQCSICEEDIDRANTILQTIPISKHDILARFLNSRGYTEEALQLAEDPELKFDLCIELKKIDQAYSLLQQEPLCSDKVYLFLRWKRLSDVCIEQGNIKYAIDCSTRAHDFSALLLLLISVSDKNGLKTLSEITKQSKHYNIAFISLFLIHDLEGCIQLFIENERYSEAAFFARTYVPSRISEIVKLWKNSLLKAKHPASSLLADPNDFMDLFPQVLEASQYENILSKLYSNDIRSIKYQEYRAIIEDEESFNPMALLSLVEVPVSSENSPIEVNPNDTNEGEDMNIKKESQYFSQETLEAAALGQDEQGEDENNVKIEVNIQDILEEEKERQKDKSIHKDEEIIVSQEESEPINNDISVNDIDIDEEMEDLDIDTTTEDIHNASEFDILENNNNKEEEEEIHKDITNINTETDDEIDDLEKELANI